MQFKSFLALIYRPVSTTKATSLVVDIATSFDVSFEHHAVYGEEGKSCMSYGKPKRERMNKMQLCIK